MPPNRNSQDFLLILSQEEREAADAFVARRLKLLGEDAAEDVTELLAATRATVAQYQAEAGRIDPSTRLGAIRARVYQNAIQGTRELAAGCAAAISRVRTDAPAESGNEEDDPSREDELVVAADDVELQHAAEVVESAIADMPLGDLRRLRDACSAMVRWWSSERGQAQSLHLEQFGDVATASGRMAIRKAREDAMRDAVTPMRAFFQELNLTFQKRSQGTATPPPIDDNVAGLDL